MKLKICTILFFVLAFHAMALSQSSPCNANTSYSRCSSPVPAVLRTTFYIGNGAVGPTCGTNTPTNPGDYWIKYVAGSTYDIIRFTVSGRGTATDIDDACFQIYTESASGSCPGTQPTLLLQNCVNLVTGSGDETYYLQVTNGTTYYFRVFDYDGNYTNSNNFQYCIDEYLPGDFTCNAIDISSLPFTYAGNTSSFTNHTGTPVFNPGGVSIGCLGKGYGTKGAGPDMFFKYVTTGPEWVNVQFTGTTPGFLTELAILKTSGDVCAQSTLDNVQYASCLSGSFYKCYNPSVCTFQGGFQADTGKSDAVERVIYLNAAGTYYFRVDGDAGSPFTMNLRPYTPDNGDACTNAIVLTDGVVQGLNNFNADYTWGPDDPTPYLLCAGSMENTMWMQMTSDAAGSSITVNFSNPSCFNSDITAKTSPYGFNYYNPSYQFGIIKGNCGGTYDSIYCKSGTINFSHTFTPDPSTTYYIVVDGSAGSECSWDIVAYNIVILPVSLVYFRGKQHLQQIQLNWQTAVEVNNDKFIIERSPDGKYFNTIGKMDGKGNTNSNANYGFIDPKPHTGNNFYRLKQVDLDGKYEYSNVINIPFNQDLKQLYISPNPFNQEIDIRFFVQRDDILEIIIHNSIGHVMYSRKLNLQQGNQALNINTSKWEKGIYIASLRYGNQSVTKKIIK
jgi:type IX secretion system substrate protein